MMGETIFPPASLSFMLDANRVHLVEATASDRNGEQIPFAAEDETAPRLSSREQVILRCITEGASNKCIARTMDITEATVKTPRQGDSSQDPSEKSDTGRNLGHKKWISYPARSRWMMSVLTR